MMSTSNLLGNHQPTVLIMRTIISLPLNENYTLED